MMRLMGRGAIVVVAVAAATATGGQPVGAGRQAAGASLIRGALVIDGLGTPARRADVRVVGDRVVAVGALEAGADDRVIDAAGLILAPGFIDTHSHHDRGLDEAPDALAAVSQGITTIIVGQDGSSSWPLSQFFESLEAAPPAVNVGSFAGHGTLRRRVLGDDFQRGATPGEVAAMQALLEGEMAAGALGMSTGLEYDPGLYSDIDEVVALATVAASAGGRYASHMRSEDRALWDAVAEAIEIGRRAAIPVHLSHLKLAMVTLWGQADRLLGILDDARADGVAVSADVYPYTYWQSTMRVLFPERDFTNRAAAAFALDGLVRPEGLLVVDFEPEPSLEGRTLAAIAAGRGVDPVTAMLDLLAEAGDSGPGVVATSMDEADVTALLAWPFANVCSDGALAGAHPRGFGAFPRVLRRLVRDERRLTLEEAVRKMTSLAAANVGLPDRGVLAPGRPADLVLFDPETVGDRATTATPHARSTGVHTVWVNGEVVFSAGQPSGRHPGRILRRR